MANFELIHEARFSLKQEDKQNEITDIERKLEYIGAEYHRNRFTLIQSAAAVAIGFGNLSAAESLYFTAQHDMTLNVKTVAASSTYGIASGGTFQITRMSSNKIISLEATNQDGIETNDIDLIVSN